MIWDSFAAPTSVRVTARRARRAFWAAVLLAIFLPGPALAQTAFGVRAGSPGVGLELTTRVSQSLNLRVAATAFDYDVTVETDSVRYDGDAELRNLLGLVDLHPGGGSFRLSVGAAFNENGLTATAPLIDLVAGELPPGVPPDLDLGRLVGTAEGDTLAPYAGIGFGNPVAGESGWTFALDLGAIYIGELDVDLELETPLPIGQIPGAQEVIDLFLAEEEEALEAEIADYDILPVISFSLSYRF